MTTPRSKLVSADITPFYHCYCRCVRQAFLCGEDRLTGESYSHRKQWLVDQFSTVAEIFAIHIASYSVMSNHYHLVVRLNPALAASWSDEEIVYRWGRLYRVPATVQRYLKGESHNRLDANLARLTIKTWRGRLSSLSWFMRNINEPIARQANFEDGRKGRFWEGRFRCKALLDERAVLAAMVYTDLNPIRANIAPTPEESDYTSVQQRIARRRTVGLLPFKRKSGPAKANAHPTKSTPDIEPLPFSHRHYIELVDWTGRRVAEGKRGSIDTDLPPILERLAIDQDAWSKLIGAYPENGQQVLGPLEAIKRFSQSIKQAWLCTTEIGRALYRQPKPT